ncbi:MAG: nucleoside deaminase [Candidatus Cloacimonetes bacterium]|jgi:tRNA(adenine34) deaminase|nr:tRNA adenosine(34) deaminase TadA [Candidatus Cloacimonadota bacterium]MDX9949908.1 tRNA adenosine(34) deaminase TadA [Candidatus Syntrophosphaera sp.]NLN84618.1 nucleoside deaminase [Candidatus Cloacimonadota bacterium]
MELQNHIYWMNLALDEARKAFEEDEIPVGAVLVKDDELIAVEHNRTRQLSDPLAHAEKLLIDKILRSKIKYLQNYRLYVTLEPCLMCAGTIILSRLGCLVFGASDPKSGAVGSIYNVLADKSLNHRPSVVRGVLEAECGGLLKSFFQKRRL